jgi:hypothetical protein
VKPLLASCILQTPRLTREEMVGLPNRAARCRICQGHKIKVRLCLHVKRKLPRLLITGQCDLSRPACSRCKRLSLSCEYPDLQRGQIFVNRNLKNPRLKAVDVLSNHRKEERQLPWRCVFHVTQDYYQDISRQAEQSSPPPYKLRSCESSTAIIHLC